MDVESLAIVEAALALRQSHPDAPPLDVLDLAMQGRHGGDHDFTDQAGGDHTDPTSSFGQLLRAAFAADHFTDAELLPASGDGLDGSVACRWQERVIEPFARRYGLWWAETSSD